MTPHIIDHPTGVSLTKFQKRLTKVPPEHNEYPDKTVPIYERLAKHQVQLREYFSYSENDALPFEKAFDYNKSASSLAEKYFSEFTFEELCKVWYSRHTMMQIDKLFTPSDDAAMWVDLDKWLLDKVVNSMWRWGCHSHDWNAVVDAYDAIPRFDFGLPDFTVTIDHTTWHNDRGYSYYSRTYLDGVFGYMIHYKHKHVLTIGFSVTGEYRILLTQVQLREIKKNRWMYKLPLPLLDFVVERMRETFPNYRLYLTEGQSLANRIKMSYTQTPPSDEILDRVAKLYNCPLRDYRRAGRQRIHGQDFYQLFEKRNWFKGGKQCAKQSVHDVVATTRQAAIL